LDPVPHSEPVPHDGTEPAKHQGRGGESAGGEVDVINAFVRGVLEDIRDFTRGLGQEAKCEEMAIKALACDKD